MKSWGEPHYVEGEGLSSVIGPIPKSDGQVDMPQWHGLPSRHDAMELCSDGTEVCSVDAHFVERFGVHDVEATAPIHQYFGEPLWTDDRINDKWVPSQVWDGIRMVGPIECYGGF